MWIVCITSVRHVLTVNGYGGRQTKENEKSWCFKGWETLENYNYHKKAGFGFEASFLYFYYFLLHSVYHQQPLRNTTIPIIS